MGRHAGSSQPVAREPGAAALVWLERGLLGLVAGAVIALVLRWAGLTAGTSLVVGIVVLVLVPVAAWVASTVPGPAQDDEPPA
ncbi:hypothetical protein [Cellulomonas sp.]|uniref:hypothetical protein n=1 Tax=Cellulomonas sp. TaxID=40001 RepID=UPI0025831C3B|nr:hypothetical protein [Cellulomonas sp.]MCR6689528.1 hypothetical protein [Cellulomonas sp.]